MPFLLFSHADCHFCLKIIRELHQRLLTLEILIFPQTVTKRNLKRQKTHQFLPLPPLFLTILNKQRFSRAVGQILTPKTSPSDKQEQNQPSATKHVPNTPTPVPNAPLKEGHHSRPSTRQEIHPTFAYLPIHKIFFAGNDANDNKDNNNDKPPPVPLVSPDALTSSTRAKEPHLSTN
jgi:hypothetical protein